MSPVRGLCISKARLLVEVQGLVAVPSTFGGFFGPETTEGIKMYQRLSTVSKSCFDTS